MIRSNNSSRSQRIRIGGGLFEMSSIKEIFVLMINNFSSLIELEVEKWLQRHLQILPFRYSMNIMILFLYMHILQPRGILCLLNGNKWKLIKFLMVCSLVESNGIKTKKNRKKKINYSTLGLVDLEQIEVWSILLRWSKNFQAIINHTTLLNSIFLQSKNESNGSRWMRKIDPTISYHLALKKWGIFLCTIN